MEIVFTLLAVILLVILPIAFLLLMVWGLIYAVRRAIWGEKSESADPGLAAAPPPAAGTPAGKVVPPNGNRGA